MIGVRIGQGEDVNDREMNGRDHSGSFEPTVMFFGMTNLSATFQAIMNEILRDLINEGKIVAFVDDVLVGMKIEKGHDEIVEEILKRLEENDLYVKPKKYV